MWPFRYLEGMVRAIITINVAWWIALAVGAIFGVGISDDYPEIKDSVSRALGLSLMPESVWHFLAMLLLIWLTLALLHRETMRYLQSGRIVFEAPFIHRNVALRAGPKAGPRILVGHNDIAKIIIRNNPYDGATGNAIEDSYATIEFYRQESLELALRFDYPRWEQNPKPNYDGNPRDHIRDEWNRRTLRPTGEPNTLNFLVKSIDDNCAFGFRTRSQLEPMWHDERLRLEPGDYFAKLTVSGSGLSRPAEKWLKIVVGTSGQSIEVESSPPINTRRWI